MKPNGSVLAILVLVLVSSVTRAADWPQWRGPHRDGISQETGLLQEWPAEGPSLAWQAIDIGEGYSTPAIVGDRIYLISNKGMEDEYVQALDTKEGKEVWRQRIGNVGPNKGPQYPGSRSTVTVDGGMLYALGSDGDLTCLEASGGKVRWQKNLRTDFAGEPGQWAYAESPLIDGDILVCTPGGAEATIVALDKRTGEGIWKSAIEGGNQAAYASAIVVNVGNVKQYVQFLQKGLVGVDATTGKLLWRYERTAQGSPANIPTPVADGNLIYSAASRSGGGLVKLTANGNAVDAEQVYFEQKLPTSIGGAVEVDGLLFGTTTQGLICADFATGEPKWLDRSVGASAVCFADGRLYLHSEEDDVALVVATAEGYQEKGRFKLPNQPDRGRGKAWAYPVVANGRLYIRDLGMLWCYDVKSR
ncbi:MAG TPA: PQQ-binding-like beta-propeller repeat protein [Pirellulales bacterium]|jgi:outer membrane protein assembly factor BamB